MAKCGKMIVSAENEYFVACDAITTRQIVKGIIY
jgi:hypothetical protein